MFPVEADFSTGFFTAVIVVVDNIFVFLLVVFVFRSQCFENLNLPLNWRENLKGLYFPTTGFRIASKESSLRINGEL